MVVIIIVFLIIGVIGGVAVGAIVGSEVSGHERGGEDGGYMMGDKNDYDNRKDGEGVDDKGGVPNSDENIASSTNSTTAHSMIKSEIKTIIK